MSEESDAQRKVIRIALAGIARAGFALAGSGAIREHGVIDRPTEDVDLFTTTQDADEFARAVERVVADLRGSGYEVEEARRAAHFARLVVRTGNGVQLDVDMGVDWRENDPVRLDVGPVLSVKDAVGNKVSALYSRGEPRDYLDVDAIRGWGRFTDEELLSAAAARDAGFEVTMFAQQLEAVRRVTALDVECYGVSAEQLEAVKARCMQWAAHLRGRPDSVEAESSRLAEPQHSVVSASFPRVATEATGCKSDSPQAQSRTSGLYGRGYGTTGRRDGR